LNKKIWLVCIILFILESPVMAKSFADWADEIDEAQRRREDAAAERRRNKETLIDGGWDDAVIHLSAYGMLGPAGGGGGFSFDWQPFRHFAWTCMDTNYFADWLNISTLATITWRPYSFEVAVFAGPGIGLTTIHYDEPKRTEGGGYTQEETVAEFLFVFGGFAGYNLGPGIAYIGAMFSEGHAGGAFYLGYKLMGPRGR
jgi:hypothetical protein